MRTYEAVLREILEIPKFTVKNPLDHTRMLLERLGNPQESFGVIHVAGSNGKGSVCSFLANVLRENGNRVGLFTSPHLVKIEERFNLDGKPCSQEEFVRAVQTVQTAVEEMKAEGLAHPTFFEYIFAVGMVIFSEQNIEYAVLETGLGGRLDATNIVSSPKLTVITSIGLEHTEILGDTLAEIAAEKAGILKHNVPVVYDASEPEVSRIIEEAAAKLGCRTFPIYKDRIKILLNTGKKIDFSYDCQYDITEISIPFGAPYQAQNAAVALQAVHCLKELFPISKEAVFQGFSRVSWKGRMQELRPEIYFDGAHNVSGIAAFMEAVEQITKRPGILLFSMVKEKNYEEAVNILLQSDKWETVIVTAVPNIRGVACKTLEEIFQKQALALQLNVKITAIEEQETAFELAVKLKKPGQTLFCAGSLYLIGELERITGGMEHD